MVNRRLFIRQIGSGALGLGLLPILPGLSQASPATGPFVLPRSTPERQGISSAGIRRFLAAIKDSGQEFHSIMVIRHGHVVAEGWWSPYSAEHKQQLYSLSKSFISTAIGFAVAEKLVTVEDTVISFFPKDRPDTISDNLAALKVKHLLSMSVGQAKDSIQILEHSPEGASWEKTFLSLPIDYKPGEKFFYNSGATYMLSSIIKKVSGQSAHAYLQPRLYKPLNILGATWTENAEGVNIGASNLRIKTEDIAKLGLLYLQQGVWDGKQILSKEWVETASSKHIESGNYDSSWGYGYGYQFWLNPPGGFRADGAYGQYSMVLPGQDAVVAITSESADKETTMQLVWNKLLPEMMDTPLAENATEYDLLRQDLGALSHPPPQLGPHSALIPAISGKEFLLDKNEFNAKSVSFRFADDRCIFTLKEEGKPDIVIANGINHWIREKNKKPEAHSLFSHRRIDFDSMVAASAGWSDEHTLVLTWCFIEAIHGDSLSFIFDNDRVRIKFLFSAARLEKRSDDRTDITGKISA